MTEPKVQCRLCLDHGDPEHPYEMVHTLNPATFRMAWMHVLCCDEELQVQDCFDKYYEKLANIPEILPPPLCD